MWRSSGRRPAAATASVADGFAAAAAAIERPGGSGMWNEGEQAAGSGCKCKYLRRGVTERSAIRLSATLLAGYVSTDEVVPEFGGGSPFFQDGENWDINYLFNWSLVWRKVFRNSGHYDSGF